LYCSSILRKVNLPTPWSARRLCTRRAPFGFVRPIVPRACQCPKSEPSGCTVIDKNSLSSETLLTNRFSNNGPATTFSWNVCVAKKKSIQNDLVGCCWHGPADGWMASLDCIWSVMGIISVLDSTSRLSLCPRMIRHTHCARRESANRVEL
jgi:hypothetical protein